MRLRYVAVFVAFALTCVSLPSATVDFATEIRPILERHCFKCHGPDKQRNNLRLDRKSDAFKGGDSGPALVAGKSAESLLIKLVSGEDSDRVMPQKGKRLTSEQIRLLRAWIDQGASWPDDGEPDPLDWWSLKPLRRPQLPPNLNPNPIDAFIAAKLAERGLTPSPEADRRTLIRRVYFDLIGLPPTPDEVGAFVHDSVPGAYERLVDRLLASPRYGERWARHWMDVAHFAETHGHDQDRIREHAWPYRDYLIDAFNTDKPYARFVQEQVAGDALFPEHPQAVVALGFLAAGPWDESSLRDIREDTLDRQIGRYLDRDDVVTTVMQTFTSSTVQCARCHDHKFDPISQKDYYSLQAVFAGVDRANRRYDADPAIHKKRRELRRQLAAVEKGDRAFLLSASSRETLAEWQRSLADENAWRRVEAESFTSAAGATLTRQEDDSILAGGARPEQDTYTISASSPLQKITAVRLELLTHDSLPQRGPGRAENGNLHLNEFQVLVFEPNASAGREAQFRRASADFSQEGWTIAHAIDKNDKTAWGIHPNEGKRHEAVFEFAEKVVLTNGTKISFIIRQSHGRGHLIGRFRLSVTDAEPHRVQALPAQIREILAKPSPARTEEEQVSLAAFYQRDALQRQLVALPEPRLVYAAASDFEPDGSHKPAGKPRTVSILRRGDIRQPRDEATAGALECVKTLPAIFTIRDGEDEAARRAALARWLTHRDNPLTWRSIVNRIWHHHFGRGIVDTPNDFGRMGSTPSHPELLDWLAVWFRDNGGSLKQLHRLIATSATYRQHSSTPALQHSIHPDPDNHLLWRMNRSRLDAESIRDAVLAISGCLDLRMGGPSDRQFDLKPGIHVTPQVNYAKFDLESAAGRRRSVYRFLFRTLPDPIMEALDCPAGDQLTAARNNSVTVQQALALWNSAFIAHYCERLAERLTHGPDGTADVPVRSQIRTAFELTLAREPTESEVADFTEYTRQHGLSNACRLLFNSNEFVFVN